MTLAGIKSQVKDNKKAKFSHYKEGNLWYVLENEFTFPVPISDIDLAELFSVEKAMFLMRWIRKHIEFLEKAKSENNNV